MKYCKILLVIVSIIATARVWADTDQTVVHVTPQVLATQAGIPLTWKVSYQNYYFAIENETDIPISIAIQVNSSSYPKNVHLDLSSTWVETGGCGVMNLGPKEYVICKINPNGHLELLYNLFPDTQEKPRADINGYYTLMRS